MIRSKTPQKHRDNERKGGSEKPPLTDSQEGSKRRAIIQRLDDIRGRLRLSDNGGTHDAFMLYEQIRYFRTAADSPKLPGEHELSALEERVKDVIKHGKESQPQNFY